MASAELSDAVQDAIAQSLGVPREKVKPEMTFLDDLDADSIDILELVLNLEKKYTLSIPEQDARKIRTVQDVIDYVAERVPGGA